MKKNLSCRVEINVYRELKQRIPVRQVSPLVNNLLKEYLVNQEQRELKSAYQDFAKNEKLKKELAV